MKIMRTLKMGAHNSIYLYMNLLMLIFGINIRPFQELIFTTSRIC